MEVNKLTDSIIGAAIEVHRELGPGKPEPAYEAALARELALRELVTRIQKPVPIVYKGIKLECGYRLDILVNRTVVVEVKAVEAVLPVHQAQTLTYLKLGGWKIALLLNFNVAVLKDGVKRLVLGLDEAQGSGAAETPVNHVIGGPGQARSMRVEVDSGDLEVERLAQEVISSAIAVHRELGPGLLPSAYEECLCHELRLRSIEFQRAVSLPLTYKGAPLAQTDTLKLVVGNRLVVEPSALDELRPVHEAELLSRLRLGGWRLGLLVNFNTISLHNGIRRIVLSRRNGRLREASPPSCAT